MRGSVAFFLLLMCAVSQAKQQVLNPPQNVPKSFLVKNSDRSASAPTLPQLDITGENQAYQASMDTAAGTLWVKFKTDKNGGDQLLAKRASDSKSNGFALMVDNNQLVWRIYGGGEIVADIRDSATLKNSQEHTVTATWNQEKDAKVTLCVDGIQVGETTVSTDWYWNAPDKDLPLTLPDKQGKSGMFSWLGWGTEPEGALVRIATLLPHEICVIGDVTGAMIPYSKMQDALTGTWSFNLVMSKMPTESRPAVILERKPDDPKHNKESGGLMIVVTSTGKLEVLPHDSSGAIVGRMTSDDDIIKLNKPHFIQAQWNFNAPGDVELVVDDVVEDEKTTKIELTWGVGGQLMGDMKMGLSARVDRYDRLDAYGAVANLTITHGMEDLDANNKVITGLWTSLKDPTGPRSLKQCDGTGLDWKVNQGHNKCAGTALDKPYKKWKKCSGYVTWIEANDRCKILGARLCTVEELQNDETAGSGCGYDRKLTWSSSLRANTNEKESSENQGDLLHFQMCAMAQAGKTSFLQGAPRQCLGVHEKTAVSRCCADEVKLSSTPVVKMPEAVPTMLPTTSSPTAAPTVKPLTGATCISSGYQCTTYGNMLDESKANTQCAEVSCSDALCCKVDPSSLVDKDAWSPGSSLVNKAKKLNKKFLQGTGKVTNVAVKDDPAATQEAKKAEQQESKEREIAKQQEEKEKTAAQEKDAAEAKNRQEQEKDAKKVADRLRAEKIDQQEALRKAAQVNEKEAEANEAERKAKAKQQEVDALKDSANRPPPSAKSPTYKEAWSKDSAASSTSFSLATAGLIAFATIFA